MPCQVRIAIYGSTLQRGKSILITKWWTEMAGRMRSAAELAQLVGWTGPGARIADWAAVERAVRTSLPVDYRDYAAVFPTGEFQSYLTVPVADENGLAPELPELRRMLERSARKLPDSQYNIYPAPGGLLPWGYIAVDEIFCWDTTPEDPDEWETVVCTIDLKTSERYVGTMTACIYDLVRGQTGLQIGAMDELAEIPPMFGPVHGTVEAGEDEQGVVDPDYWLDGYFPLPFEGPRDATAELSGLVARRAPTAHVDWTAVETRLNVRLPDDYKRLAELLGPGEVGAVILATPHESGTNLNIERLLDETYRRGLSKREKLAKSRNAPIFPEPGGIIPWGWNRGGWILAWLTAGPDPEEWPVLMVDKNLGSPETFPFSATGLLHYHLKHPQWMEQNTNDDSWQIND